MKSSIHQIRSMVSLWLLAWGLSAVEAQSPYAPGVKALPTRAQMPVANVNAVMQDAEGYMWYATYEGGVCRDDGYQIDVFRRDKDHPALLSDNVIHALCEAPNGEIWFSTARQVYVLDKHSYAIRPLAEAGQAFGALHMERLGGGKMLLVGDTLTCEVEAESHRVLTVRHVKSHPRSAILQPDGAGGVWVCHADRDLCYTQGDTAKVLRRYGIAAKNILLDRPRRLLFALTPKGLQVFHADGGQLGACVYEYGGMPEIGVFGLYLDRRRQLWVTGYQPSFTIFATGTGGAARKLNVGSRLYGSVYVDRLVSLGEGRLSVYKDISDHSVYDLRTDTETPQADGAAPSPPASWRGNPALRPWMDRLAEMDTLLLKDAAVDARGHLWAVFDQYAREVSAATGRHRDISATGCGMGMNNFSCVVAAADGVCIGGAGGVCYFPGSPLLDADSVSVPVAVSSYEVSADDGRPRRGFLYADGSVPTLSLSHASTCLTLHLTSFNHVHAPGIRFAVRVVGWNDDWVSLEPGESVFRMVNLPKGDYRVLLRATDEDGLWGREREVLRIHRLPAWWESWWAYTLYACLLLAALSGAFCLYRHLQRQRERFDKMLRLQGASVAPQPQPAASPAAEEEVPSQLRDFSDKAIAAVKANLDDEAYTVDRLAEALCMSRVNLYRKMMTACGQTPSDFIRTLRMEHAYRLLSTTDLPVNIVASQCGFTSSSYFAKCFKARFGVLPTALRR